jgi:uncharacterized protein
VATKDDVGRGRPTTDAVADGQLTLTGEHVDHSARGARERKPRSGAADSQAASRQAITPGSGGIDISQREQEFFIPVHGEVRLRLSEVAIVDHPAFQRLGDIFQLGQTYLVYRGATHKRLEHALGALHVAHLMIQELNRNRGSPIPKPDEIAGSWRRDVALQEDEIAFTRLGALLHDVGHLPAGHTLEDELGVLGAHDGDARLDLVLDRKDWHGRVHSPTLRDLVNEKYATLAKMTGLKDPATNLPLTASDILKLLISKDQTKYSLPDAVQFRLNVCRDIIGNTICADLLDYLHRDWLHLGKRREFDQRLLSYMEIRARIGNERDTRLVINLRGGRRLRTDAVTAILDLLESRYQLAEIALFHRTKCAAAAMLERVIAELADSNLAFLQTLPENLLDSSDSEMLSFFDRLLLAAIEEEKGGNRPRLENAQQLSWNLRHRRIYKEFVAYPEYTLADMALEVQERYGGPQSESDALKRAKMGAANRLQAVRCLETDFGMSPCSLVMYCPPRKMNTKIAKVQVLIHGDVHTLDEFESEHGDHGVTGGHLKAQKERFRRLWRVVFAISSVEQARLEASGLLEPLGRAIELCVLRMPPATSTLEHSIWSLALELTHRNGSPLHKREMVTEGIIAARSSESISYPGGAPSLLACVQR